MRTLTVKEAKEEYKISRSTLMNIVNKYPKCCFRIGRAIRIDADVLDDVIKTREEFCYKVDCEVNNG